MWCCMYPSLFRFKRLIDKCEIENSSNIHSSDTNSQQSNETINPCNNIIHNDYDSISITNNLEEFKSLFKTQEKMCYELRSENTVLKMKLEVANEMNKIQIKKIQSLKMKKGKLEIENNVYKNVLCGTLPVLNNTNFSSEIYKKFIRNENEETNLQDQRQQQNLASSAYPPPPPPPLPLPPQNKIKVNGSFLMNNVLDELKSKIKKFE